MFLKVVVLAVLCTLVNSNAVYTVYKNSMVGPEGQTCEDYLQTLEGTYFNQSIYAARLEEQLECKDTALEYEKQICDLKLTSNCNGNTNLEQKVVSLEEENKKVWELLSTYNQVSGNMTGFVPLPSLHEFALTDCGEGTGATLLDVIKTSHKRYFTPNPHFAYSWHAMYMNWTQSYNYCNNCGLRLASFETQSEFDELDNYFKTTYRRYNQPGRYNTGALRLRNGTHDVFTWLNGQTVSLSNDSFYEYNNQIIDGVNTMYLYQPYNPIWYESANPYNRTLFFMYGSSSEGGAALCESP